MPGRRSARVSGGKMIRMQIDVILVRSDATALTNFHRHGTTHHITRGQVLGSGGVTGHEGFTLAVSQDASLSSTALRQEATSRENTCRVELHELKILEWQSLTSGHTSPVASAGVR